MAKAGTQNAFRVEPYQWADAHALSEHLGLEEPVAIALVRRGHRTVAEARAFLDADEAHDPFALEGIKEAAEGVLEAVGAGRRITVHGDYDVDGVCATAILVAALREAGADCDWMIPDRLADGYGLSAVGVERLIKRHTELLLTVDCGIGSPDEVAAAQAAGIEVIVTDHHQPSERLPECLILHPRLGNYPCPELCGAGVAFKLAEALRTTPAAAVGEDGRAGDEPVGSDLDLDLVALATVADVVPLRGENRTLVRRGIAALRRARRPGIRALIASAGVEAERLDEGDIAFRLAPRINAAGRLYRADAGVELLLTEDLERAERIAAELSAANGERRAAEAEVLRAAEAELSSLAEETGSLPALVLCGDGWHPGVIGIVASRLAERHWRPVILISLDGKGGARGSGRSIPGFDLLAGLRACSEHLVRYGGHSAAAGLEIEPGRVEAFREAFVAHSAAELAPTDLVRTEPVDAVVGSEGLGTELAEQLERLAPFGAGNPGVRLLVPTARIRDLRPMGKSGAHARFTIEGGGARASAVAFDVDGSLAAAESEPHDLSVRLEINRWNGAEHPRAVLGKVYPLDRAARDGAGGEPAEERSLGSSACRRAARGEEWWERVEAELGAELRDWPPSALGVGAPNTRRRSLIDRGGDSTVASVAELISSGAPILAICADAARRRELAERTADPRRFGGGAAALACGRCEAAAWRGLAEAAAGPGLALCDWQVLTLAPSLPSRFAHLVLLDPPPFAHLEALARRGEGFLHLTGGSSDPDLALRVHSAEWDPRPAVAEVYRALRAEPGGTAADERLAELLAGPGRFPRSPEAAARPVRVLCELGLVSWTRSGDGRELGVVSSERTELERSSAYSAYRDRHQEGARFLESRTHPR